MKPNQVVEFLRRYNKWRRGDETLTMEDPAMIGNALDEACDTIDRLTAEIVGWNNKWQCAVEMAALAEAKLATSETETADFKRMIKRLKAQLTAALDEIVRIRLDERKGK